MKILLIRLKEHNIISIEKKYDIKNSDNVIIEDENENSDNDTINNKTNNIGIDKILQNQKNKDNLNN